MMNSKVGRSTLSVIKSESNTITVPVERISADEENLLAAIQPGSQEAIVSCLSLHWVNDLPGKHNLQ
jgi:NADH dehydrogenase [ubiquinone] 1 alpha subcomplex assembly factor 5